MPDAPADLPKLPSAHAKRLAWALKESGHLLAEALRKDTSAEAREVESLPEGQIPAQVVSLILEKADPTQNKGMTAWLVKQYAQGGLRLEDTGTANETLTMFQRYAQRLGPVQRDLGRYPHLAAVWEAVIGFANDDEQRLSGKAQKALDKAKAYDESRILCQDPDGFTIAVPLTEFAAKWWGRGTRWCTAAEKENRFWLYHKEAPLIVVVIPELKEKSKFQLWVSAGEFEFMDASDEPVADEVLVEHWSRFEPIILHALRKNVRAFAHVPEKLRTNEVYRLAVAQNGLALNYVPKHLRTEEMCRIAVAEDGWALESVPWDLRTDEMCRIAVAQKGEALECVPLALRTEEMCSIAVAQNGRALARVPEKLRTNGMCIVAVAQNGGALGYVPQKLRTEDLCRIAVAQKGWALGYVPQKLRTAEMCRIAVAHDGSSLSTVSEKLRTAEMCRIAVAQNGEALGYVPWDLRTEAMCNIAVAQHGEALRYAAEDVRTETMCMIAVAQNGLALEYVPEKLCTEAMCKTAVAQNAAALKEVPAQFRSAALPFTKKEVQNWPISHLDELADILKNTPAKTTMKNAPLTIQKNKGAPCPMS